MKRSVEVLEKTTSEAQIMEFDESRNLREERARGVVLRCRRARA
jgi:translation elongation factor EF-Tu-like GTPase